jgi:PIN domain nuclease of toxin-antitoxin system
MKYLLDTHIFLWALNNDKRLKKGYREILTNRSHLIYVSVVSAWEISIKLKTNPRFKLKTSIKKALEISGYEVLDISLEHVFCVHKLPMHHKDPFDRMLIAQAKMEKCILITDDSKIKRYNVSTL